MRLPTTQVKGARCEQGRIARNGRMNATSQPEEGPPASPPRPAASLIVIRWGAAGPELLMGRRGAGHRFMPNVLVFPGGAVDAADHFAPIASPLQPAVQRRLERSASPALALALAVAAARELTEEVGLSLGDPPALDGFDYLCRAITPPDRAMRFDARFFVVDAARITGEATPSHEIEAPGWYTPQAALAAEIAQATRAVLGQLNTWLDTPDRHGPVPVLRDRAWSYE